MVIQKRAPSLFVVLGLGILLSLTCLIMPSAAYAQDTATPTSIIPSPQPPSPEPATQTPTQQVTQVPTQILPSAEPATFAGELLAQEATLQSFRISNIALSSPIGVGQIAFELPANWRPEGQSILSLNLEYFETIPASTVAGPRNIDLISIVDIYLDDNLVSTITLDSDDARVGAQSFEIPLPTNLMLENVNNRFLVTVVLRAQDHCLINSESRVVLHSDASFLRVEYQEITPELDLSRFPYPLYLGSFDGRLDSIYLVLPDTPSLEDLQAAMFVVTSLGRQAFNDFIIKYRTVSTLSQDELGTANLIVIGDFHQNELIADWLDQELLAIEQTDNGDLLLDSQPLDGQGYLELIPNPQNPLRVALLVTGVTPEGVQLAARSLTLPTTFTKIQGSNGIVSAVPQLPAVPVGFYSDNTVTLAELGISEIRMSGLGAAQAVVDLPIPFRTRVIDPSYLDITYRFSSLLETSGSILNVILNEQAPLATFYLETDPAQPGTPNAQGMPQTIRVSLPPDYIIPGIENEIAIIIETNTTWNCNPPGQEDTWLIINDDSTFSLSLEPVSLDSLTPEVAWFPAPFNSLSDMSDVWISLPDDPTDLEIEQMLRLMGLLSSLTSHGVGFQPHLSIGEIPSGVDVSQYHFIILGRPSTNSLLRMLNNDLPQPFSEGSDQLVQVTEEGELQPVGGNNIGVLQILPSIWSPNHLIMVISGTSSIGQSNAISILVDQTVGRSQLDGDIILVQDGVVESQNSEDLAEAGELLSSISDLGTQAALEATATADARLVSTVTPGPSPTFTMTTTPAPTSTPTSLFSLTPSPTIPTPIPTFVPLQPETLKPAKLEQPGWVNLALIAVGIVVIISVLFGTLQMFRPGRKES